MNMTMKNRISIVVIMIASCIIASCDNFEDMNQNPDQPNKVSPEMLATQILKNTYRFWNPVPDDFQQGTNLMNKHIALLRTNPNPAQYFYSYYPYGSFGAYAGLTDLRLMSKYSKGTKQEPSYNGLELFLKASLGFSATLNMGDVPYSEAGKAHEGITKPKYDKQEDVFKQVLEDFRKAEEFFARGEKFDGDMMFNGDAEKWRRLSNAMQLKVLQTLSRKITDEQKTRFASIVEAGHLMQGNDDNLRLIYSDNPNAGYPFWNGETHRSYTAVSKLCVDALKQLNDRRLLYFAEPAEKLIKEGKKESEFDAYEGAPTELSAEKLAVNNSAGMYSLINKRYPLYLDGEPMLIFTYSEQCFIIAEAIEEGWVKGDAKDYYEKGVRAMLEYYMNLPHTKEHVHGMAIDKDYIKNYFTGAAAYAVSGSKQERLQQIWIQRWLIDFFQGNGGNYPQFLRTGYPVYPLDASTCMNPDDKTTYPKRWMYPTGEQTANPENYHKAIDEQYGGYDGINQVPWYLK